MEVNPVKTQWTDEHLIDLVRKLRNDLIKDFLDERNLKSYVLNQFGVSTLSPVKLELIKKDLKTLLISPVNLNHYEPLMIHIQKTDSAALTENHEELFYQEIENVLKKFFN